MAEPNPYQPPAQAQDAGAIPGSVAEQIPALWNPEAAACWSLLFSPVFGSILVSKNWNFLGEWERSRHALIWTYAWIGMFIVATALDFLPVPLPPLGINLIFLAYLLVWYFASCKEQVRFVRARFGKRYPRRRWGIPLLLAVGITAATLMAIFLLFAVIAPVTSRVD